MTGQSQFNLTSTYTRRCTIKIIQEIFRICVVKNIELESSKIWFFTYLLICLHNLKTYTYICKIEKSTKERERVINIARRRYCRSLDARDLKGTGSFVIECYKISEQL